MYELVKQDKDGYYFDQGRKYRSPRCLKSRLEQLAQEDKIEFSGITINKRIIDLFKALFRWSQQKRLNNKTSLQKDMILTKEEILGEIKKGNISIEPFDKEAVGPASIDLRLSNRLRIFNKHNKIVKIEEILDYKNVTKIVDISKGYTLKPKELVLGITEETITLPEDICGWLNSRSRFARLGLMSHSTAPFICPGVSNRQVLEIYNAGPNKLKLFPGTKICQLILQRCEGRAKYQGKYVYQEL